jgi:hypothetical protein
MADKVIKICMDIYRKLEKSRVLNIIERLQIPNILEIWYLYNLQWKYVKKYISIQASIFLFVSSVLNESVKVYYFIFESPREYGRQHLFLCNLFLPTLLFLPRPTEEKWKFEVHILVYSVHGLCVNCSTFTLILYKPTLSTTHPLPRAVTAQRSHSFRIEIVTWLQINKLVDNIHM